MESDSGFIELVSFFFDPLIGVLFWVSEKADGPYSICCRLDTAFGGSCVFIAQFYIDYSGCSQYTYSERSRRIQSPNSPVERQFMMNHTHQELGLGVPHR